VDIDVKHNERDGTFETQVEGGLAYVEYVRDGNSIRFTHTLVPKEAEGKGVAAAVATAGLEYARANGLRVVPICRYVHGYIERHPEYQDLVDAES
jgi:predicted GNAT family acetyltransferase